MLEPEEIKDLIADSIKSAVCIDDQYAEPYQKLRRMIRMLQPYIIPLDNKVNVT